MADAVVIASSGGTKGPSPSWVSIDNFSGDSIAGVYIGRDMDAKRCC